MLWSLAFIGAGIIIYFGLPCLFDSAANWYWRLASIIALGTVYCLGILFGATPRLLFRLSLIPLCSPNWLSLQRIWIIWLGQWIFLTSQGSTTRLFSGFLIVAFGLMLDRLDGKQAQSMLASIKFVQHANDNGGLMANSSDLWAWYRVEEENDQGEKVPLDKRIVLENWISLHSQNSSIVPMFHIEPDREANPPALRLQLTYNGDWIDPLSDKFNFLPLFCYLAYCDLLYWPMAVLMVTSDLFSTVLRKPFQSWPGFRRLQKYIRDSKASPFGKTKIIWQISSLLSLIPAIANWLSPAEFPLSKVIASCLLGLGLIAGVLSTASRLTLWNSLLQAVGLRRAYQKFKKGYEHQVEDDLK